MSDKTDIKVALTLLEEVSDKLQAKLQGRIVTPIYDDYEDYNHPLKEYLYQLMKQCKLADKKAHSDNTVLIKSNLMKAQIHANWIGNMIKSEHKNAIKCYENALTLVDEEDHETEALIRYRYGVFCGGSKVAGRDKAIQNLKRAIELVGEDSERGIDAATILAKIESEGEKGGCFVASAIYGSYSASEVLILRDFRDQLLLKTKTGAFFVKVYYFLSPPAAAYVSKCGGLRILLKKSVFDPFVKFLQKIMQSD